MSLTPWVSYHVYYHSCQDLVLTQAVSPLLQTLRERRLVGRFFFLRYWTGGPHLRLRFEATSQETERAICDEVESRLSEFLCSHPSVDSISEATYLQIASNLSVKERVSPAAFVGDNTFRREPYLPEWAKYGGSEGVRLAETVFDASSGLVLDLLHQPDFNRSRRMAAALTAMMVAASTCNGGVASAKLLFDAHAAYWSQYGAQIQSALGGTASLCKLLHSILNARCIPPQAEIWYRAMLNAWKCLSADEPDLLAQACRVHGTSRQDFQQRLLLNYCHTHNNRLGILPAEEAQIGYLGARAVDDMIKQGERRDVR